MTRVIQTAAVWCSVGDEVEFYDGPVGAGRWVTGVIDRQASSAGPGGAVAISWWLDWMEDGERPFVLHGGKDVRLLATVEYRALADELDDALARIEWLTGCPDGCGGHCYEDERQVEDVVVLSGVV